MPHLDSEICASEDMHAVDSDQQQAQYLENGRAKVDNCIVLYDPDCNRDLLGKQLHWQIAAMTWLPGQVI